MTITPKQLANLKPVKKGDPPLNPKGRPKEPFCKERRRLTLETFREDLEEVMNSNLEQLQAIIKDPKTKGIKLVLATSFVKAAKNGDYSVAELMVQRIVGKIPENITVTSKVDAKVQMLSDEALKERLKKIREDV